MSSLFSFESFELPGGMEGGEERGEDEKMEG